MKKYIALILSIILLLCLCACKDDTPDYIPTPTQAAPETSIDPTTIDFGYNAKDNTSDKWYLVGSDDFVYIYFTVDAEDSSSVCKYHIVKSGTEKGSASCIVNDNNHLTQSAIDSYMIDIVFQDIFTAYDYTTGEYYSRGDYTELFNQIAGMTFEDSQVKTDTVTFNTDGSCTEYYDSQSYAGTWEITSTQNIRCKFEENVINLKMVYNEEGKIRCIEYDDRTLYNTVIGTQTDY